MLRETCRRNKQQTKGHQFVMKRENYHFILQSNEGKEKKTIYKKRAGQYFLKGQTFKNSGLMPIWSLSQVLNYPTVTGTQPQKIQK